MATTASSITYYGRPTPADPRPASFNADRLQRPAVRPDARPRETKDTKDTGATLVLTITQAADEAATKSIVFNLPRDSP